MRAAAIALACALTACNDGIIRLSSGAEAPDATSIVGADASSFDDATSGTSDGGAPPSSDAQPPGDGAGGDAGHGCLLDTDCPLASLHCDLSSGTCVQCTKDPDCTKPGYPRCDLATHLCVACGVNADCADGGVCDPMTLHCVVPCSDAGKCAGDDVVCNAHGYCSSCDSSMDGGGCSGTAVCNDDIGQCGECTNDSQCSGSTPHCRLANDTCVQCLSSSQCPTAAAPVCDPATWTCVP